MMLLLSLMLGLNAAEAHPTAGRTSVIVVMKGARCPVCVTQLRALGRAELAADVVGMTHDSEAAAAAVTRSTGVRTSSHPAAIRAMGLWLAQYDMAQPAIVVYDRCGTETGRILGRGPGRDETASVRRLVAQANAVASCGRPSS